MDRPLFLDTSIIIAAIVETSLMASRLVFSSGWELHTNDYVIKEVRRVLRKRYGLKESEINRAVEQVRGRVAVHRTPPPDLYRKLCIRDKSDRPIVSAARSLGCVLILDDEETYQDALNYVAAVRLDDLIS